MLSIATPSINVVSSVLIFLLSGYLPVSSQATPVVTRNAEIFVSPVKLLNRPPTSDVSTEVQLMISERPNLLIRFEKAIRWSDVPRTAFAVRCLEVATFSPESPAALPWIVGKGCHLVAKPDTSRALRKWEDLHRRRPSLERSAQ